MCEGDRLFTDRQQGEKVHLEDSQEGRAHEKTKILLADAVLSQGLKPLTVCTWRTDFVVYGLGS